jgi:hypothetical protein
LISAEDFASVVIGGASARKEDCVQREHKEFKYGSSNQKI